MGRKFQFSVKDSGFEVMRHLGSFRIAEMFIRGMKRKSRFPPRSDNPVPYGTGRHVPMTTGIGSW